MLVVVSIRRTNAAYSTTDVYFKLFKSQTLSF